MKNYLIGFCVFIFLLILLRVYVFEIYTVRKDSMRNTYSPGDRVLILKNIGSIERNNSMIFRRDNENMIKRCVGLPGDSLEINEGIIYINGDPLAVPQKGIATSINDKQDFITNSSIFFTYGKNWDLSNFGPYIVPSKGMVVSLSQETASMYAQIIAKESPGFIIDSIKGQGPPLTYTFKHNYFFLVGDNRQYSKDSRVFGPIANTDIIGEVVLKF
jgi:signal peptidase I